MWFDERPGAAVYHGLENWRFEGPTIMSARRPTADLANRINARVDARIDHALAQLDISAAVEKAVEKAVEARFRQSQFDRDLKNQINRTINAQIKAHIDMMITDLGPSADSLIDLMAVSVEENFDSIAAERIALRIDKALGSSIDGLISAHIEKRIIKELGLDS